jgi:protein-disulfide isomerase
VDNDSKELAMAAPDLISPPSRVPAGAPDDGDGIALGTGPVTVDLYIDFLCPFCRMFEEEHGRVVDELVERGAITAVYHPMGYLDRLSSTRYSTRAAAASGCASDGGRFLEYMYALFDSQPPEGSAGLSDEELIQLGLQSGLDESFASCVSEGAYLAWTEYVTARALARGVNGTPSVYVEGVGVPASGRAIVAAVAEATAGLT